MELRNFRYNLFNLVSPIFFSWTKYSVLPFDNDLVLGYFKVGIRVM